MDFSTISTALITPFFKGELDKASFIRLLEMQTQAGLRSFVLGSTTGEGPTLEEGELDSLCHWFREFEREKQIPLQLVLPAGSYSTKETLRKIKKAEDLSADALLLVTPYYNRPSQKGLLLHFEQAEKASSLPIVLYNVPARTACSLSVETIETLSKMDKIIGIKEASGDMTFLRQLKQVCPKGFFLLSGDDPSLADFLDEGGDGAISAGANVLAKEWLKLLKQREGRKESFKKYKIFLQELFKETNPTGVKQALMEAGVITSSEMRLPLLAEENKALLTAPCKSFIDSL